MLRDWHILILYILFVFCNELALVPNAILNLAFLRNSLSFAMFLSSHKLSHVEFPCGINQSTESVHYIVFKFPLVDLTVVPKPSKSISLNACKLPLILPSSFASFDDLSVIIWLDFLLSNVLAQLKRPQLIPSLKLILIKTIRPCPEHFFKYLLVLIYKAPVQHLLLKCLLLILISKVRVLVRGQEIDHQFKDIGVPIKMYKAIFALYLVSA